MCLVVKMMSFLQNKQRVITCIAFFLFFVFPINAQEQEGYVKTLGRPGSPGVALEGVTIRVRGGHNAVISDKSGSFSVPLPGLVEGTSYQLQYVSKQGYELNDKGMIGRNYAFSQHVRLPIVMVSRSQLALEKNRIESVAFKKAEERYKKEYFLLEKALEEKRLSIEEYGLRMNKLQESFDKYQEMIPRLSEHYAHIDYDSIDKNEQRIIECIERGDLDEAESFLKDFNAEKVLIQYQAALESIERRLSEAEKFRDEALALQAEVMRRQEKDAEHLFQLYTIALGRFDNEKARFYIETRAALDTMRVQWQLDAGEFWQTYAYDIDRALAYYNRTLRITETDPVVDSLGLARTYNSLASIYNDKAKYQLSLFLHDKAISLLQNESYSDELSISYDGKADIWRKMSRYADALSAYSKAIDYCQDPRGKLTVLMNQSVLFMEESHFNNAKACLEKADSIIQVSRLVENDKEYIIWKIHCLSLSMEQGHWDEAYRDAQVVLSLAKRRFGEVHPVVSGVYSRLGEVCQNQGAYEDALRYFNNQLKIDKLLGITLDMVAGYHNVGNVKFLLKDFDGALEDLKEALSIGENLYRRPNNTLLLLFGDLATIYEEKQMFPEAIACRKNSIDDAIELFGKNNKTLIRLYTNLGVTYCTFGDNHNGLAALSRAEQIYLMSGDDDDTLLPTLYRNLAKCYENKRDANKAILYYKKSIEAYKRVRGEGCEDIACLLYELGSVYNSLKKDKKMALEYFIKACVVFDGISQYYHPEQFVMLYNDLGDIYTKNKQYSAALEAYDKAIGGLAQYDEKLFIERGVSVYYTLEGTLYASKAILYAETGEKEAQKSALIACLSAFSRSPQVSLDVLITFYYALNLILLEQDDFDGIIRYTPEIIEKIESSGISPTKQCILFYNAMLYACFVKDDAEGSARYLKAASEICIATCSPESEEVQTLLEWASGFIDRAKADKDQRKYDIAELYLSAAAFAFDRLCGGEHPRMSVLYNQLGAICYARGDFEEAVNYSIQSLEFQKSHRVPEQDLEIDYTNLAYLYGRKLQNHHKAIEYLGILLDIQKRNKNKDVFQLAKTYHNLGEEYYANNDFYSCIESLKQARSLYLQCENHNDETMNEIDTLLKMAYAKTKN